VQIAEEADKIADEARKFIYEGRLTANTGKLAAWVSARHVEKDPAKKPPTP
jgi:hypothetical protein